MAQSSDGGGGNCCTVTCCCAFRYGGEPSTSPAGQTGGCHHACVGQTSRTALLPGKRLQVVWCFLLLLLVYLDSVFLWAVLCSFFTQFATQLISIFGYLLLPLTTV